MRWRRVLVIGSGVLAFAVAGAMALLAVSPFPDAKTRTNRTPAMELRRAVEMWRGRHGPDDCPTPEQLRREGAIDRAARLEDPWGAPFRIICEPDETVVLSLGPDGREGTADDIRVPEPIGPR
jgi:hypothetical protein